MNPVGRQERGRIVRAKSRKKRFTEPLSPASSPDDAAWAGELEQDGRVIRYSPRMDHGSCGHSRHSLPDARKRHGDDRRDRT